jgi:WS/DGAT/MGAT family acyltransferase
MPMHTMGTVILDPSDAPGEYFGYDAIVATIEARIHLIRPFRQRLLEIPLGLGHPILVDDPDFQLDNHIHRLAVHAPGTMRELADIVGDLAGPLLDRSQPLWEMWVIEGLENGQIALVTKLHHCIVDGASGSSQMAQLMDLARDTTPEPPSERWDPAPLPTATERMRMSMTDRIVNPLKLGRLVLNTAQGLRSRRKAQLERLREGEEAPPLFDMSAPETMFGRSPSRRRNVAFGSASLTDVKAIKNAFGVTVNDAVLAACALALRRYLEAHDALPDAPLCCMVPVSTKSDSEKSELSNKVSTIVVELPTHLSDPEEMVAAVQRKSDDAKHIFAAIEHDLIPAWLQYIPPVLTPIGARLVSDMKPADTQGATGANLVVSNMMGPPIALYFGGAAVEAVYPMGPIGEGFGLNITVLSNRDRLDVGVLSDPAVVPDLWEIASGISRAVGELLIAAEKQSAEAC